MLVHSYHTRTHSHCTLVKGLTCSGVHIVEGLVRTHTFSLGSYSQPFDHTSVFCICRWMEYVLGHTLPKLAAFETSLPNGVSLCLLGKKCAPQLTALWRQVYDTEGEQFKVCAAVCVWREEAGVLVRERTDAAVLIASCDPSVLGVMI